MMQTITDIKQMQEIRRTIQASGKSIGFVATMGNLHAGHLHLLRTAANENDVVILSIFVNPAQFNDSQDFKTYPRTLEQDLQLAKSVNTDFVFVPQAEQMYADNYRYRIDETELSLTQEGKARPGHFAGVLTVVMKLLQITQPSKAYFGEKDFQQLQLIKGLAQAFFLQTEIVGVATVRNQLNLALSSRNQHFNPQQLHDAHWFYHSLSLPLSIDEIKQKLVEKGFIIDYIEECAGRRFGAVFFHGVRLIDNLAFEMPIEGSATDGMASTNH